MKIGVVGLWHLGCVLSASWPQKGHSVTGLDTDPDLVKKLNQGEAPVFEPGLNETLKKHLKKGSLKFTTRYGDLKDCAFVFLAYDTPVLDDDSSDLKPLEKAIENLDKTLKDGAVVIVSSQTPAGTCARFRKMLQAANPALDLACSPENLRLGEAIANYLDPGRIVLGTENEGTRKKVLALFKPIPAQVLPMNLNSAEMVKHGINSFLAMSVTFSNELSDLCESSGADVLDVIAGMKSDPRIGPKAYLSPGIGFSGGTLGRDLKVLEALETAPSWSGGLFKKILALNSARKSAILEKIKKNFAPRLKSRQVGVLGLTYKPGTSTLRRSLPAEIVRLFLENQASVSVFDPKANYDEWTGEMNFKRSGSAEELVRDSELVVLMTEWPEFRSLPWKKLFNPQNPQTIFDAKNFLVHLDLKKIGYHYIRIGRNGG